MDQEPFLDMSNFKEYEYNADKCDCLVERYEQLGRVYLAIMLEDRPIGEVVFKKSIWKFILKFKMMQSEIKTTERHLKSWRLNTHSGN